VLVGDFLDQSFVIENIGGGTLEGEVTTGCTQYSIQSGGGAYALGAGASVTVVVRFQPTVAGYDECTILTGTDCVDVTCTGTGEEAPVCEVTPETLDFGTVTIGQFAGRNFTIRNAGGGTLTGEVSEACSDYSITSNGGPFSLEAGEQITVGVRFTPTTPGLQECTVETGQDICADVACSGTGEEAPACVVTPTALNFGTVTVGEFFDLDFTIENVGGGLLEGTVSEACNDFDIIGGSGAYSLANGEQRLVTVRFSPSAAGPASCTIDTGTECDDVTCNGEGQEATACEVTPTVLDFGTVTVGEFVDLTFTISNTGGGVLSGEVTEACADFELISGGGAYNLGAGESVDVTVRFSPSVAEPASCTIATGTECADVSCTGTGEDLPECLVTPTDLNFGTVTIGEFFDLDFTIENVGGGLLEGTVVEACADFEITAGSGAYSLASGEQQVVTVRFSPTAAGPASCTIATGTECADVSCSGTGQEATACDVTPTVLNFGTVTVGEFVDLTFTISNTGGGVLSGEVTEACADFELISGGGAYDLGPGEFVDVTVRFSPSVAGPASCTIATGTECADVSCTGAGELPPICDVAPNPLNFGTVSIGGSADLAFTIFNLGGGILSGTVSETCPDFDLVIGGGAYALGAGEFVDVVVRFEPSAVGPVTCTVETGTECDDVTCNGEGQEATACEVTPTVLDFGTVMVGDFADLTFTISNTGGGVLSGEVTEACADFEIISGGGAYNLNAGEFVDVVVRFAPLIMGPTACEILTGTECASVFCAGAGDMPPVCDVTPTALDFGDVVVGNFEDLSFTITNTGGGILSGEVFETCDDFDLVEGAGPYDLGAGESVDVTVRFGPTSLGPKACTVGTGAECVDVSCTGTGAEEVPVCMVDPIELDFGTVPVGEFYDLDFYIANLGGGTLTGEVSETCDDFELDSGGGPYSLGPGEIILVTVRFAPSVAGPASCTIETGTECENVICTGVGRGEGIEVYFDIKPGSCPNALNVVSKGVLPTAILGTEMFNVMDIDLMTLQLMRDGMGGVLPVKWAYEDVGTPFMGDLCDCHDMPGDGITDLTLKFDTEQVVAGLGLQSMPEGDLELMIGGNLIDGEPIIGADCVRLKGTETEPSDEIGENLGFSLTDGSAEGTGPEVEISFHVAAAGHVYLEIFDVRGRTVRTLVDETLGAGNHTVVWDKAGYGGVKVQSGIYFARLRRDSESKTKKIIIVN
jgi:hypothetical protein